MQVKLFSGNNYQAVEEEVNKWLFENPSYRVAGIAQSESGDEPGKWSMTITILFEEG